MSSLTSPKSRVAREQILDWIRSGDLSPGQQLPAERELSQQIGVNSRTVRRALAELVDEGVIVKQPRVGNFVRDVRCRDLAKPVALVVPSYMSGQSSTHPAVEPLLRGINAVLDQREYANTILYYEPERFWIDTGEILLARGIRGAIIWWHTLLPTRDVMRLAEAGLQLIAINAPLEAATSSIITIEASASNSREPILRRLLSLGHRRIVVFDYTRKAHEVPESLTRVCEEAGIGSWSDLIVPIPNEREIDCTPLLEVFNRRPLPTAIIVPDEYIASRVFQLCYERQIRIPHDLSLAALADNTPHAHPVSLTAVNSLDLMRHLGEMAARGLRTSLKGEHVYERCIRLQGEVQWKDSVASPRNKTEACSRSNHDLTDCLSIEPHTSPEEVRP